MKKFFIVFLCFIFVGTLKTYYFNKGGYNNKIPYHEFFNGHSPKPTKIKVQKGKVQAVIPINQKEEKK